MTAPFQLGLRVRVAWLLLFQAGCVYAQSHPNKPRFEDYPANDVFTGAPTAPKLVTPVEQRFADEIRDGVEIGYGVGRNGEALKGPNFAGHLIVIQWGCGAPCLRMAMVDARSGEVYYPPISSSGIGALSFDLPLLPVGEANAQNPKLQFRLNSNLMTIQVSPGLFASRPAFTYYFLWRQNQWTFLKKLRLKVE